MTRPHPATFFPNFVYTYFLSYAAEVAARLGQEDRKANAHWVPAIISPKTLKPIEVDRANIRMGLDWTEATTRADIAKRFPAQTYDGTEEPRLATPAELKEIFARCGETLPVHSPKTAWLSSTRGVSPRVGGRGLEYDGTILTVNSATGQAKWLGPDDDHQNYGLLFVRDERSPS